MKTFTRFTSAAMLLFAVCISATAQSPALKFNNTDNRINLSETLIGNNPNYTIEMWVKAENGGNGSGDVIYCEGLDDSNGNTIRIVSASGKIRFWNYVGSTKDLDLASSIIFDTPATWYHVAFVGTTPGGAGTVTTVKMYINGEYIKEDTYTKTTTAFTKATIGALSKTSNQTGTKYNYNGELDELRLWSRALTATEIANNACEIVDNSGLVSHFRFNEAGGTTTKDEVSGNLATIEGTAPTWTTNDNCTPTSIESTLSEETISMYPNPTTDMVYFNSKNSANKIVEISIFNTTGTMVFNQKNDQKISVDGFSKGMYFVNIVTDNGNTTTKKLIIN